MCCGVVALCVERILCAYEFTVFVFYIASRNISDCGFTKIRGSPLSRQ